MKKLNYLQYILLTTLLIGLQPVKAQTLPPADEIGGIMGGLMCEELITTGTLKGDYAGEKFAEKLIDQYGEENLDPLMEKMNTDFSGKNISQDPYLLEVFRNAFVHISNDVNCFQEFVKTF